MMNRIFTLTDAFFVKFPGMRANDSASESEIDAAEMALGMKFPVVYRQFLARYGGAVVGPYPVYGLRPNHLLEDDHWSVVDVTQHHRKNGVPEIAQWIIFSEDHAGNPIGFDGAGKVWIFDHDFAGVTPLYPDFEMFLQEALKLSD